MPSTILNSTKFILMKNNRSTFNFIFQKYKLFLDRSYITVQKKTFNSNLGTGIEDKCLLSINSLSLFNLTYPSHINFSSCKKLCWNCNSTEIQEYFCNQCKLIQPIDKNLNYFALLGIETSFKVCKSSLTLKFRKLQNVFHPDKYSMKSTNEMDIAAEHSSLLNKAYNVILHPVSRGEYMLLLEGKPIHEAEMTMDSEFLMEIMDINERLADAEDKETVQSIGIKNNSIMEDLLREAEKTFEDKNISEARNIVAKLKYYYNIYEKVKEYETKHGIIY